MFGSVARGDATPTSDLDVAVLLERPPLTLSEFPSDLADALERETGRRADVVVVNRAPADLIHRVLRDGVLVVDRDRSKRIRFEVAARNRFFDMTPVWNLYRYGEPT